MPQPTRARETPGNPGSTPHGLLLIRKPTGWTSHDVVQRVRRVLHLRKVGHLGTLDPIAEGLLPLALGLATRLSSLLINHDKVYESVFRLGVETDTHDRMGRVTAEHPVPPNLTPEELDQVLAAFRGTIDQTPPLISAKKYRGRPLYWWVRRGKEVPPPPPKRVTFYAIEVLDYQAPRLFLRIHCSAGAYIRALARDLGQALGCGAIVDEIRRIQWGHYSLDQAIDLEEFSAHPELCPPHFLPMAEMEPEWPVLKATAATIDRLMHGQPVPLAPILRYIEPAEKVLEVPYIRVLGPSGELVAVARVAYPDKLLPLINFPQLWPAAPEVVHEDS